jgi:hypothetical protein
MTDHDQRRAVLGTVSADTFDSIHRACDEREAALTARIADLEAAIRHAVTSGQPLNWYYKDIARCAWCGCFAEREAHYGLCPWTELTALDAAQPAAPETPGESGGRMAEPTFVAWKIEAGLRHQHGVGHVYVGPWRARGYLKAGGHEQEIIIDLGPECAELASILDDAGRRIVAEIAAHAARQRDGEG